MSDVPSDSIEVPRVTIDWYRSTPWWRIASQSINIAWRGSHIAACAAGLIATHILFFISFLLFQPEELTNSESWIIPRTQSLFQSTLPQPTSPDPAAIVVKDFARLGPPSDSFIDVWKRFLDVPSRALVQGLTLRRTAYTLLNLIGLIAIWSFIGGCLCRRSAAELGTRISLPWTDTLTFVLKRWQGIAWAISMPLCLTLLICLLPIVIGWISNIPYLGPWLAGLLMLPFAVFLVGIGWCIAITMFGFSLSTSAIVCEKRADAFDGLSRAAAYTFQRPLTLILCIAFAEVVSRIAGSILATVFQTGYQVIARAFEVGSFYSLDTMGTWFDGIYANVVPLLLTAFGFSFFWTCSAATYLILRRDVDNAEFDLIDMDDEATKKPLPSLPEKPEASSTEPTPESNKE